MSYKIKFQSPAPYSSKKYGKSTIGRSACGPSSLCNALANAGIADVSVPSMCKIAEICGARVEGGTIMDVLLRATAPKYNFDWRKSNLNRELMEHLRNGGTAICWCGGDYPLFSNSGHFVSAVGISPTGLVVIADSLYYNKKWSRNSIRVNKIHTTDQTGIVNVEVRELGRATDDRPVSYFLISKPKKHENGAGKELKHTMTPFIIEGEKMKLDAITEDGHTYVDLAQFCKRLGLTLGYNADTKERIIDYGNLDFYVNDNKKTVTGTVTAQGHSIGYLPEIAIALGYIAEWDAENKAIRLREAAHHDNKND